VLSYVTGCIYTSWSRGGCTGVGTTPLPSLTPWRVLCKLEPSGQSPIPPSADPRDFGFHLLFPLYISGICYVHSLAEYVYSITLTYWRGHGKGVRHCGVNNNFSYFVAAYFSTKKSEVCIFVEYLVQATLTRTVC
jgi:hypothetical protein